MEIEMGKRTRSARPCHACRRGDPVRPLAQLLSFALRALGATRAAPKQSLEKTALIMTCVVGQIACCGVLFILSFYFKTGANKLVDIMVGLKLPLGELMINVVARISVPNEPRNFCKDLTICSKPGIASFQECECRAADARVI